MYRLSFLTGLFLFVNCVFGQPRHGKGFKIDCEMCHTEEGWEVILEKVKFDHSTTGFTLYGQHQFVGCKKCHKSLEFSKTRAECRDCHTEMHNNTVGWDCARCHNSKSWIIPNITQLHQQTKFPLLGRHATADCYSCHKSASLLQFEPLGTDCYDCHKGNYELTTSPPHANVGYSTNCIECHTITAPGWLGSSIHHSFFPLTGGHAISCVNCHSSGTFGKISKECNSCHSANYNATTNPSHAAAQFPRTCESCHNINAWTPATFNHDGPYFPIFSGKHRGEWTQCSQCHQNSGNYASFTCLTCHEHNQASMDNEHRGKTGYSYTSTSCYSCHPRGSGD